MAYTPKHWVCGETITDVGLNNIEEGIQEALDCCGGGSSLPDVTTADNGKVLTVVNGEWDKASREPLLVNNVSDTLDKTWQEIRDAVSEGRTVYYCPRNNNNYLTALVGITNAPSYYSVFVWHQQIKSFETNSPTGYPVYVPGD